MASKVTLMTSILQYAMEGKLVKQDESDSSSLQFLTDLLKEKNRSFNRIVFEEDKFFEIINNKKIDISKEISVRIPSSWTYIRLNSLADNIEAGGTPSRSCSSYWDNGDIPWVKIGDMQSKYVDKTSEFITKAGLENSSAKIFPKGTILYSIFASIGTTAFLNIDASTNQAIAGLFFDERLNKEFIYYFLKNSAAYMLKQSHGTAQNNINQKILKNMIIPFPPIEEQQRIVERIKELEPLVDEYEELVKEREMLDSSLSEKLKLSVLKSGIEGSLTKHDTNDLSAKALVKDIIKEKEKAVKDGLGKKDNCLLEISSIEEPFKKPDNWEWIRFGDLGFLKKGPFGSDLTKGMFVEKSSNSVKVYEQQNAIKKNWTLGTYYIKKDYYDEKMYVYKVEPGDIIVSCAGTIGETYIVPDEAELGIINQALMRMKITKKINHNYFLLYFDFILKNSAKKESNGTAIKNIPPFDVLKNMLVAIPPFDEQNRIVETVNRIYSDIDSMVLDQ